ncbi:hypothetical protein ACFV1N_40575 [Streptosporangium canum]
MTHIEPQVVFSQLIMHFAAMRLIVPIEELRLRSVLLAGGLAGLAVVW